MEEVKQAYLISGDLLRVAENFFLVAKKLPGENDNLYRYARFCLEYAQMARDELETRI